MENAVARLNAHLVGWSAVFRARIEHTADVCELAFKEEKSQVGMVARFKYE